MKPAADKAKDISTTIVVYYSQKSISAWLAPYGVAVSGIQIDQIQKYVSLLLLWNQKVSLTSIEDPQELVSRHFGESFFGAKFIENQACRLADVGSGAGFPGLALKIALPSLQVTLIEQDTRKATFLNEVIRLLNLEGIRVIRTSYQSIGRDDGDFDVVSARAVGDHKSLLNWAAPMLSAAGRAILWLGTEDATRLSHTQGWNWQLPHLLPNSRNRVLLVGTPEK